MNSKLSPTDIERLRRIAKKASRVGGITYTEALDKEAKLYGCRNWAVMQHELASAQAPQRFPVLDRTWVEMHRSFLKVKGVIESGQAGIEVRRQMTELSPQFADPLSALYYSRDYLELAVSLPKFDPHPLSTGWVELRVLVPYVFEPLSGTDRFIILGRDYKPLGVLSRDDHVDYEKYKNLHVCLPTDELLKVTGGSDYRPRYLYSTGPYRGRQHAKALLLQLEAVIELVEKYELSSQHEVTAAV